MNNKLIAPCGLNCETFDARIATTNDDYELRAKTAAKWYLAKGFTSCAQCDDKRTCKDLSVFISNNKDAYERIIDGK